MSRTRQLYTRMGGAWIPSVLVLATSSLMLGGCKAQQAMQTQLAQQDDRIMSLEKRVKDLDGELKSAHSDINGLTGMLRTTNATVHDLQQQADMLRQKEAEAAAKAAAAAQARNVKKPVPKKRHK